MTGDIIVDNIWPVAELPQPGRDGLVKKTKMETGGAILNSAILLDRLGMKTVLLGCMGEDLWASYIRQSLTSTNIDLSSMQTVKEEPTGIGFNLVTPDGERTMFAYRGANKLLSPDRIDPDIFDGAGMLHISGYAFLDAPQRDAVWQAIALAGEKGIPISLDTGLEPVLRQKEEFLRVLPHLAICISGLAEIDHLLGAGTAEEAAGKLLDLGVSRAAIKLGKEGSLIMDVSGIVRCPQFQVEVVDTTGAGDAYSAGLIYGWQLGFSPLVSGMLASALGAMAVRVEGAGLSLPDKDALLAFLRSASWPEFAGVEKVRAELIAHF